MMMMMYVGTPVYPLGYLHNTVCSSVRVKQLKVIFTLGTRPLGALYGRYNSGNRLNAGHEDIATLTLWLR